MAALFTLTSFLAALLLFSVQPLVARLFLPSLGGSPAVWNTAMVFFQAVLLGGYLYSHALGQRFNRRGALSTALVGHGVLLLLPLLFLPLGIAKNLTPPATAQPILWLLGVLGACVGLPFFVLSTSSPLLQRLFALTSHSDARDPYFLYAASNAGSLLALLLYPIYFEPNFALSAQSRTWAAFYGLYIACFWACLWAVRGAKTTSETAAEKTAAGKTAAEVSVPAKIAPISWPRRARWVALSLVPSSLMLSVTTYLSTNVAAIPLLWILPLSLYLASFMIVFARRKIVPDFVWPRATAILILPLVIALVGRANEPLWLLVPLHLPVFFVAAVVCHGEMARDRPDASQLTEFYGWMALGGVLGGIFNALLAPIAFADVTEYPLSLIALALLLPRDLLSGKKEAFRLNALDFVWPLGLGTLCFILVQSLQTRLGSAQITLALLFGVPAALSFLFSRRPLRFGLALAAILACGTLYRGENASQILETHRSFFGVHRVLLSRDGQFVLLMHGSTLHGVQKKNDPRNEPLSYYWRRGPMGDLMRAANAKKAALRVAVVGLGGGSQAAYIEAGQKWTFYEIDPIVAQIARDSRFFRFWNEAPVRPELVLGDARLKIRQAGPGTYDLIVLDAYSSDSIPVHLLTREAMALYREKLAPGGLIACHISNRNFDLEPVVGQLARDAGWIGLNRKDEAHHAPAWVQSSQWAVLAKNRRDLGSLAIDFNWKPLRADAPLWTDEKSSLWPLLWEKIKGQD